MSISSGPPMSARAVVTSAMAIAVFLVAGLALFSQVRKRLRYCSTRILIGSTISPSWMVMPWVAAALSFWSAPNFLAASTASWPSTMPFLSAAAVTLSMAAEPPARIGSRLM